MKVIASIVEGHGEVSSVPILLRRLSAWLTPAVGVRVLPPIRVHRDQFLNKAEEFQRYLQLAGSKCEPDGWVLVVLDADDDCPATLGPEILARARSILPEIGLSVVLIQKEYEAWFIAAAASLDGERGFRLGAEQANNPEAVTNAKGWVRQRMDSGSYGETTDQPAFTARMSLDEAQQNSPSFRKLCREWTKNVVDGDGT